MINYYIPTTEEVRWQFARNSYAISESYMSEENQFIVFNRWLEHHDNEVRQLEARQPRSLREIMRWWGE